MAVGYYDHERMALGWLGYGPTPFASVGYRDQLRMVMGWVDGIGAAPPTTLIGQWSNVTIAMIDRTVSEVEIKR